MTIPPKVYQVGQAELCDTEIILTMSLVLGRSFRFPRIVHLRVCVTWNHLIFEN